MAHTANFLAMYKQFKIKPKRKDKGQAILLYDMYSERINTKIIENLLYLYLVNGKLLEVDKLSGNNFL